MAQMTFIDLRHKWVKKLSYGVNESRGFYNKALNTPKNHFSLFKTCSQIRFSIALFPSVELSKL